MLSPKAFIELIFTFIIYVKSYDVSDWHHHNIHSSFNKK